MFEKLKAAKQKEKEVLNLMLNFAEGRMSTEDFWAEYKKNDIIREILIKDKTRPKGYHIYDEVKRKTIYVKNKPSDAIDKYFIDNLLAIIDISKLEDRCELFLIVKRYFVRRKKKLNFTNKDSDLYGLLVEIQPDWLDIRDENFLLSILNAAPENLIQTKKIRFCKDKIKELFRYDSKPPKWIQSPEWPIVNGQPLVFKKQSKETLDDERVYYYFYHPTTKEETIITQFF